MTKGGVRTVSASKAVAKGMGIPIFINVLKEINRYGEWISIGRVHRSLAFGGNRTETCRSYFKECWRYGFVDCSQNGRILTCTPENWSKGGEKKYKINSEGTTFLSISDSFKSIALGWYLVHLDNATDFEQVHKTFNALKKQNLPLNYFMASKITGVVRDSIKALMFGWLEPLGLLYRVDNSKKFCLNMKYYNFLKKSPIQNIIPKVSKKSIKTSELIIETKNRLDPIVPDRIENFIISIAINNISQKEVNIEGVAHIYSIFENLFTINNPIIKDTLKPGEQTKICIKISSYKQSVSESFCYTQLGEIEINNTAIALPDIYLTTASDLHEANLANLLSNIGFNTVRFSKSDRPDMVISYERKEEDLEKFLQNDELKILVETTSAKTLSLNKVIGDLDNFLNHTTKVLKINAKRTLIVGIKISPIIFKKIEALKKKYHPFTIMSIENLQLLKNIIVERNIVEWDNIEKIICYNGIVEAQLIKNIYRN